MEHNKTRTEVLDDKIKSLNSRISKLKNFLGEENVEVIQLNRLLETIEKQKEELSLLDKTFDKSVDNEINNFKNNGILAMNIENVRIQEEQNSMKREYIKMKEEIIKLNQQIVLHKANLVELANVNNDLMRVNMLQEEHISKLKDKAYGVDIGSKYDVNKYRQMNKDSTIHENVNNNNLLWDKENIGYEKTQKFDEFAKENQLWLGNAKNNLEKVKYDNIENNNNAYGKQNNKNNINTNNNNNGPTGNMRKYSPLIMNNK
jgi:hypothetical protein